MPSAYRGLFVLYSIFKNCGEVRFVNFAVFLFVQNCEILKTVFQNGPIDSYWCKE